MSRADGPPGNSDRPVMANMCPVSLARVPGFRPLVSICLATRPTGVLEPEVEVKKFHAYRALFAVAAIVAVVVESGAGHKFG
jgi:hypothetical protein